MKSLLLALFLISPYYLQAETLTVLAEEGDRLQIQVVQGSITFKKSKSPEIKVSFKGKASFFGGVSLKKEDQVILVKTPSSFLKETKKYDLLIEAPSLPLHVTLTAGELNIAQWDKPIQVVQQSGQISLKQTAGKARLSLQKGKIKVNGHQGGLAIDSYKAHIDLKKIKGALSTELFAGNMDVSEHRGDADFLIYKGRIKSRKSYGSYGFRSEKAQLNFVGHKGSFKGKLNKGRLQASLIGSQSVRINSQSAPVTLKVATTGARADLGTLTGYLTLPPTLARARVGQMLVSRGRLSGSAGGQVYVRTESGNIKLH